LRLLRAHYSLAGPGAAQSTKKFPPASCSPLVSERRNRSCSIRHSGRGLFVALHYGHRASGRGLDWVIRVDLASTASPPIPRNRISWAHLHPRSSNLSMGSAC